MKQITENYLTCSDCKALIFFNPARAKTQKVFDEMAKQMLEMHFEATHKEKRGKHKRRSHGVQH